MQFIWFLRDVSLRQKSYKFHRAIKMHLGTRALKCKMCILHQCSFGGPWGVCLKGCGNILSDTVRKEHLQGCFSWWNQQQGVKENSGSCFCCHKPTSNCRNVETFLSIMPDWAGFIERKRRWMAISKGTKNVNKIKLL